MRQATGLSFLVELYPVFQNAWQYFQDFFFSSIYFKTLKKYTSPNRFGIETMSWSSSVSLNQVTFNPLSCILMSQPLANSTVKKLERKQKKKKKRERERKIFPEKYYILDHSQKGIALFFLLSLTQQESIHPMSCCYRTFHHFIYLFITALYFKFFPPLQKTLLFQTQILYMHISLPVKVRNPQCRRKKSKDPKLNMLQNSVLLVV